MHHTIIFDQRERRQLAPAIIEPRVVAEVFVDGGQKVVDPLLGYLANVQCMMALFGESIGVKSDKWVLRSMFLQRVVESEKAGEVLGIGDEGSPDYKHLAVLFEAPTARRHTLF